MASQRCDTRKDCDAGNDEQQCGKQNRNEQIQTKDKEKEIK